ncbi:MAG TPA: hypothetical protein VGN34_28375 [Ktedonobacteraceae bacterium]|jgi:hypothetical protein
MNIEHFTENAREAISKAAQVARQHNHHGDMVKIDAKDDNSSLSL